MCCTACCGDGSLFKENHSAAAIQLRPSASTTTASGWQRSNTDTFFGGMWVPEHTSTKLQKYEQAPNTNQVVFILTGYNTASVYSCAKVRLSVAVSTACT